MFAFLPVLVLLISAVAAVAIMLLPERARTARTTINVSAAALKLLLILALIPVVFLADYPALGWEFLPGVRLELRIDSLSMAFALLSSVLWLATTIYAVGYLRDDPHQRRFFAFFSLCVTATVGISFAGNLVTLVVFYELLTLVTYPLVSHHGSPKALKAARAYLFYALSGGLAVLLGTVMVHNLAGTTSFTPGGTPAVQLFATEHPVMGVAVLGLLVAGFGVKAALVPFHGWLPMAMVAPAPVSALLHAVAVVKAGAFGIVRVVGDLFGVGVVHGLGVLDVLLVWASVTIIHGSVQALRQGDLKRRLAFSTVSQVSYITLGMAMFSATATVGGLAHLMHQGITKIVLFFCAGLFAERLGAKSISQLTGLGRRMPWTSAAFTVGAFGMMGLPPLAGFVSKWTLGQGAVEADRPWVVGVLVLSAALNAAYFLPIVYRLWWPPNGWEPQGEPKPVALRAMLWPSLAVAALTVGAGLAAGWPLSPLGLAEQVVGAVGSRFPPLPTFQFDVVAAALTLVTVLLYGVAIAATCRKHTPRAGELAAFLVVCMLGNVGVFTAADAITFYLSFAVMSFSATGLVLATRTDVARRAAGVYVALAVLSESAVLAGLILATGAGGIELAGVPAAVAVMPERPLVVALFIVGFGVKAGLVPVHWWLPLAHPAAPPAASAVLSGAMVKAGVVGWLRFLPLGEDALPTAGTVLVVLGAIGAFGAVVAGMVQTNPKTVLAYSTVSQLGYLAIVVGVGLAVPQLAVVCVMAAVVYAVHHGLAKGAAFLGVSVWRHHGHGRQAWGVAAGMVIAGLAIVGAPLSAGSVGKYATKTAVDGVVLAGFDLVQLLPWVATGSTLLLLRMAMLLRREERDFDPETRDPELIAWVVLVGLSIPVPWVLADVLVPVADVPDMELVTAWDATWPVLVGVAAFAVGWLAWRYAGRRQHV